MQIGSPCAAHASCAPNGMHPAQPACCAHTRWPVSAHLAALRLPCAQPDERHAGAAGERGAGLVWEEPVQLASRSLDGLLPLLRQSQGGHPYSFMGTASHRPTTLLLLAIESCFGQVTGCPSVLDAVMHTSAQATLMAWANTQHACLHALAASYALVLLHHVLQVGLLLERQRFDATEVVQCHAAYRISAHVTGPCRCMSAPCTQAVSTST